MYGTKMWSRSKKLVGLGIGIGVSWLAIKKYGTVGIVEAGEKPPYPPQPHCIGKECPKTQWDDDWDKKEGIEALRSTIMIVAHGQADTNKSSKNKNAAKPQKVTNKGKSVQAQKLPSDPKRFVKPKEVANDDGSCIDDSNSGKSAAGENSGDVEGLSPLGVSQVKKFLEFLREEFGDPELKLLIHGTDPPTMATAKMMENELPKSLSFANIETAMLDALTPPLPGQDEETPHPGDVARLEAVFRKYFHRIDDEDYMNTGMDVVVCSPKMVGYFVCRFLQIPPDRFPNWGVANGSLTELVVLRNGRCVVQRVGDIGFMPPKDVTYE